MADESNPRKKLLELLNVSEEAAVLLDLAEGALIGPGNPGSDAGGRDTACSLLSSTRRLHALLQAGLGDLLDVMGGRDGGSRENL